MKNNYDVLARTILDKGVFRTSDIKELLILSVHSSKEAELYFKEKITEENKEMLKILVEIAGDFDDFGDSAMAATDYIKDFSINLLKEYEDSLLQIFTDDDRGARILLAIALGRIKSVKAKEYIYELYNDKDLQGNWIIQRSVSYYNED
ncbi:hypothetical protein [Paenibacillus sp. Soil724D2]|uniref:hypothetical protein n=1 Tax=Paenibacillus sp. (strain Soil724D2) TaxID=1736392 RepID=UPI00071250C7|nr:hypothetical protein [Paenibacillus sp. Soil724D2]KRE32907.1 hypothetical protein ASG85_15465 [Paenibacillus sp. Soil724D2]